MLISRDDPRWDDPVHVAADVVEALEELADDLDERAAAGDFSKHREYIDRAERLLSRLYRIMPFNALDKLHARAVVLLRRLQAACEVGACQGRA